MYLLCICFNVLSSSKSFLIYTFHNTWPLKDYECFGTDCFREEEKVVFEFLFQINPVHVITPCGLVTHLNFVSPTTP
jgi:hypothetical protein